MPLKLNVGLSRKVGEANFGSRGASVNLELELESGLAGEPGRLHDRIRQIFRLAKDSVDEELNGGRAISSPVNGSGNGHDGNGHNGNGAQHNPRPATKSQIRAIYAIAGRQHIDLPGRLQGRFSMGRPEDLSLTQASQMIDELKNSGNGSNGSKNASGVSA